MARIDPGLHRELKKYGATGLTACMNCGNCTATCPQSTDNEVFPRRIIHFVQAGMTDKLRGSVEPWLCYYCGDCSETCPRDADPGESMMAVRRYLTGQYDWTGLGRWFYKSPAFQLTAMALTALAVVLAFYFLHGPIVTDHVALDTFAPVASIELADRIGFVILAALLLSNVIRMATWILRSDTDHPVPFALLLREFLTLPVHFVTQKKWLKCDAASEPTGRSLAARLAWLKSTRWVRHFFLVTGYLSMMILVEGALPQFQTDAIRPWFHWTRLLGYYATVMLMWHGGSFLVGRLRKSDPIHKFSTPSDWMFLVLLLAVAFTGILVHIFRLSGLPLPTYVMYVVHMAVVAPFLIIQVPFGKWSHMAYRPMGVYLAKVRQSAREKLDAAAGELAPA